MLGGGAFTEPEARPHYPPILAQTLGRKVRICHFFRRNLTRTGSHFNRLVRTKASHLLRSDAECHRLHDSDLLRRLFETVLKRCINEGYRTAALAEWRQLCTD